MLDSEDFQSVVKSVSCDHQHPETPSEDITHRSAYLSLLASRSYILFLCLYDALLHCQIHPYFSVCCTLL